MYRNATIDVTGRYRYSLTRMWDKNNQKRLLICMLNPSIADGKKDDPTIRKCIGFATRRGHGGFVVVNLYALRSTNPDFLFKNPDRVGPNGDIVIGMRLDLMMKGMNKEDVEILCAWGAKAEPERVEKVMSIFRESGVKIYCLGTTKRGGHPRHPLYVPYSQEFEVFSI